MEGMRQNRRPVDGQPIGKFSFGGAYIIELEVKNVRALQGKKKREDSFTITAFIHGITSICYPTRGSIVAVLLSEEAGAPPKKNRFSSSRKKKNRQAGSSKEA